MLRVTDLQTDGRTQWIIETPSLFKNKSVINTDEIFIDKAKTTYNHYKQLLSSRVFYTFCRLSYPIILHYYWQTNNLPRNKVHYTQR